MPLLRTSLVALTVMTFGCGPGEPSEPPAPDPDTSVSHVPGDDAPVAEPAPPTGECPEGGRPRPVEPVGCDFVVEDCCYDDAETACRIAGCAQDACAILESYPAQVRCQ